MALNHWDLAIETHNTNHPDTDHDCTDVQACDPRRYPSTDILITSPECTNHSLAKGRKRKNQGQFEMWKDAPKADEERSRATMWDVPRFAEYHDYNIIIVENVVDARYWVMWKPWLMAMYSLGYEHQCCYFNSMFFHPCPQSRDRMYVVFWKKGNKKPDLEFRPIAPCPNCGDRESYQSWKRKDKQCGKYKQQYIYRCSECYQEVTPYYYCAFNAIDWTIPGKRIGDRKKPLAKKTIERIQYGLQKYGNQSLIVKLEHSKAASSSYVRSTTEASFTQTTSQATGMVVPFIVEMNSSGKARAVTKHLSTVLAGGNHHLLVGNYSPGWARGLEKPTGTITTQDHHALFSTSKVQAFLTYYYSGSLGASGIDESVNTVTTTDRASLVTSESPRIQDCYYRMLKPHEIQAAMAFQPDYVVLGNSRQKVKQLGNAVTPPVMAWIVKQCVRSLSK